MNFTHVPRLSVQDRPATLTNDATREYGVETLVFKAPISVLDVNNNIVVSDTGITLPPGIIQSIHLNIRTPFGGTLPQDTTFQLFQVNGGNTALTAKTELDGTTAIQDFVNITPNGTNSTGAGTLGYIIQRNVTTVATVNTVTAGQTGSRAVFLYTPGPTIIQNQGVILNNFTATEYAGPQIIESVATGPDSFKLVDIDGILNASPDVGDFTVDNAADSAGQVEVIVTVFTDFPTNENGGFIRSGQSSAFTGLASKFSHYPNFSPQDRLRTLTNNVNEEYGFQTATFKIPITGTSQTATLIPNPIGLVFSIFLRVLVPTATGTLTIGRTNNMASLTQTTAVSAAGYVTPVLINRGIPGEGFYTYQWTADVSGDKPEIEAIVTTLTVDPRIPSTVVA